MSQGARFRYPLNPVLLTRQWELDALLVELGEQNAALARQESVLGHLQQQLGAASADFKALSDSAASLPVQRFAILSRYMGDLAQQIRHEQAELARLGEVRDELAARVLSSQRGVEAIEQHRDEMESKFNQQRLSGEFKIADDQWSTLQAGMATHGS